MKLLQLNLKNFQGIKSFSLETRGGNADVFADNEKGKTTLFNALLWLLFNKDSQGKADFEVKTLDQNNQPLPGLDHEVEGVFVVSNGRHLTLKKTYREKWTKKRGSAKATLTGHTTDYFIDDVPVKEKEYKNRIDEIAKEDIFKLLTNPLYFNTQLHWQDRRNLLIGVCGDISDTDVIASDKSLSRMPDILHGRKLEDHRKVIASKRKAINDELQKVPVRIDEVQQSLPDITDIIPEEVSQKIKALKTRISEKNLQISRIEGGGEVAERIKALREVEGQLLEFQNNHRAKYEGKVRQVQGEYDNAQERFLDLQGDAKSFERSLKSNQKVIQDLQTHMDRLRDRWHLVNIRSFEFEQNDVCSTCGQSLPVEQLAGVREKAQAEFNLKKAAELESISADGKEYKARMGELVAENADIEKQLEGARAQLVDADAEATRLKGEIDSLRQVMGAYSEAQGYIQLLEQKENIEQAIADLKAGRQGELLNIRAEITALEAEVGACVCRLNDIERAKWGQARIEELQTQEKKLAAEFEKLEGELYLTEQFIRSKVAMLEEKINSRFKLARFRLFNTLVNGGIEECCETLYKGVPYSSMNNAARINVGLDVIRTLSEHYDFSAPVFIDNAEAVTELIDPGTQVIRLIVSKPDKKLRVEYPAPREKKLFEEAV
ncbi:MAG: AAA family ATPase [Firmicutes bacterium]|nr:AAA family ATPase [Bacillota bacterium]